MRGIPTPNAVIFKKETSQNSTYFVANTSTAPSHAATFTRLSGISLPLKEISTCSLPSLCPTSIRHHLLSLLRLDITFSLLRPDITSSILRALSNVSSNLKLVWSLRHTRFLVDTPHVRPSRNLSHFHRSHVTSPRPLILSPTSHPT